ncbi:hypothetical protein [Kitasatospora cathayae]|uniref:Uncharacterized protein n=1 Tax=Kitasatospora cathayae TaxID=3004092 RepID=A0ABY7Q2Y8_9ACTN|nr:hypothetical protein [Kitasatospora sp. HUAS 3-15]WBP87012.1 hypothetical protein O1G21_14960 [Kitasatospora sp. HUAS 3-15]
MSLHEIARRVPERHPDADECPSCQYFNDLDVQHAEHPTIQRKIAKWRGQHIADGECLTVPDE